MNADIGRENDGWAGVDSAGASSNGRRKREFDAGERRQKDDVQVMGGVGEREREKEERKENTMDDLGGGGGKRDRDLLTTRRQREVSSRKMDDE